jgi:hypothetical protein
MTPNGRDSPWLGRDFFENRQKFPAEELRKYAGQHVAWSWDGTRIVASDPDDEALYDKVLALGLSPDRVVFGYVAPPDEASL